MIKLKLDETMTTMMRDPEGGYLEFADRRGSYLRNNELVTITGATATITKPEYAAQIRAFLEDRLELQRGITRQHPLWYEVRYLRVLMPLGVGELPHWATNYTSFIPFGAVRGQAEGIASSKSGMGPGDQRDMLADYVSMLKSQYAVEVGAVIRVDVDRNHQLAFYNRGEIQVRGPLVDYTLYLVGEVPSRLDVIYQEEVKPYLLRHGDLRHSRTVEALAAAPPHTWNRLDPVAISVAARWAHARHLFALRKDLLESTSSFTKNIMTGPRQRPAYATTEKELFEFIDASATRVLHDAYVAAIASGLDAGDACDRAAIAANTWMWDWADRSLT